MEKILLIADCGNYKDNSNGVYAKNIQLHTRLKELFSQIRHVNTNNWKRNPFVLINVLLSLIFYRKANVIISLNTPSAYKLISLANLLFPNIKLVYFVIGGVLPTFIRQKRECERKGYSCVSWFLVETIDMKRQMEELGYMNVIYVPNFKKIDHLPLCDTTMTTDTKFVFVSRIIPEKGCDLIFEMAKALNDSGLTDVYKIDFYGKIDDEYKCRFLEQVEKFPNINYMGYLDLKQMENYDLLSSYHVMLFPTYWKGEGFPGVLIDAFICGLPVIATDWAYNKEIVKHGETGFIIPAQSTEALTKMADYCIKNQEEFLMMRAKSQRRAMDFDTRKILTTDFFEVILR